jgi:hypothetical protein
MKLWPLALIALAACRDLGTPLPKARVRIKAGAGAIITEDSASHATVQTRTPDCTITVWSPAPDYDTFMETQRAAMTTDHTTSTGIGHDDRTYHLETDSLEGKPAYHAWRAWKIHDQMVMCEGHANTPAGRGCIASTCLTLKAL